MKHALQLTVVEQDFAESLVNAQQTPRLGLLITQSTVHLPACTANRPAQVFEEQTRHRRGSLGEDSACILVTAANIVWVKTSGATWSCHCMLARLKILHSMVRGFYQAGDIRRGALQGRLNLTVRPALVRARRSVVDPHATNS